MSGDSASRPMRKIDDATYGTQPESSIRRRLLRAKRWFLLDADRWAVTGGLLVGVFLVVVLVGSFGPVTVRSFLTEGVSPGSALVELLKTIVSVVVIVLSINQLVLSPGIGPVGDQWERFDQSMDLRERTEEHTGVRVSPSSPGAFLSALMGAIAEQAEEFQAVAGGETDPELAAAADEFGRGVADEARNVQALLADGKFGRFDVISAALRFAISGKIRSLREIRRKHGESFSESTEAAVDELDELLELYAVAREYLKTVYIRSEYVNLSEGLVYSGLPAIVATYCAAQVYAPGLFPGQVFGIEKQLLFVAGAVAVALAPFTFMVAYVSRLAAMSRSTLFVGPFDARSHGADGPERRGRGR